MVDSAVLEGLLLEDDDEMFDDFDEEDDEALEDLEDALESLGEDDDESYADLAERRRRRRRRVRRAPTARGRQLYRSRPAKGPVTQAQLQAALNRVRWRSGAMRPGSRRSTATSPRSRHRSTAFAPKTHARLVTFAS
ncbi:MAG: hypothetical protein R3A46_14400 [Thermomicrobiales bacterium]